MGKRKNKRRIPNAQRSIESLNQEFGLKPKTQWLFDVGYFNPADIARGWRLPVPTFSIAPDMIDIFPTVSDDRNPFFYDYPTNYNDMTAEELRDSNLRELRSTPVSFRPVTPAPVPFVQPAANMAWSHQRYYPVKRTFRRDILERPDSDFNIRSAEIPITLDMFDVIDQIKAEKPNTVVWGTPHQYESELAAKSMIARGVEQSLYGQLLRKHQDQSLNEDLARVRQALANRDVNALERLLYDYQAWPTLERSFLISYLDQHAKKMGIYLEPRAPSDPPRQPNPKKGEKRRQKSRRIKNAEVTPPQLTKSFELPESTRWARRPVTDLGGWTLVEPDELVRAYPRVVARVSPGDIHPIASIEIVDEHPTRVESFIDASFLAPILKKNKTPAPAIKRLNQITASHLAPALAWGIEGTDRADWVNSPATAASNLSSALALARAGYTQSLYGDWLRLEMEGRLERGLDTGNDQIIARVRDALFHRDQEALERILYDLQAYRTPERDVIIDYVDMAAKRSGLNLRPISHPFMGFWLPSPRIQPPPPRRENPKKKKQKKAVIIKCNQKVGGKTLHHRF